MTDRRFTLVGDGIENPYNAMTMQHAVALFAGNCAFLDRKDLATTWPATFPDAPPPPTITHQALGATYSPIIACDNDEGAHEIYGFRASVGAQPAVVVGNERLGLAYQTRRLTRQAVYIPMAARGIDTLNVAAASAVALYYLTYGSGPLQRRADPAAHRPDLLLLGASDHLELGSALRSAAAFGWTRAFVEDRAAVWFGADRGIQREGRAAARRAKNAIRLIPVQPGRRYSYERVCVLTCEPQPGSTPLHRANLGGGARQLLVLQDERAIDLQTEQWTRLGRSISFAHLGLPIHAAPYHYRLPASIALAETARQIGRRGAPTATPDRPHAAQYEWSLDDAGEVAGEDATWPDLLAY